MNVFVSYDFDCKFFINYFCVNIPIGVFLSPFDFLLVIISRSQFLWKIVLSKKQGIVKKHCVGRKKMWV
eukprot:TRINITY_DN4354_c0_g1_i1.p1 TRINITY_DN4354_c0_g1~~TRINITY_DN4354_c0_g1_i1.p1  ORF type:complete len:69 (-),score=4.18 TRINITY_DN4354_c0_g1_i1:248-454(-)